MGRFWSLLFLMVPILGVLCFVWAMAGFWPMQNHWLPENIGGADAHAIDGLFLFILGLTGVIFVATGLVFFWFLWKYDAAVTTEPVKYFHGSHQLEVIWSIIPAAALLFIAIFQMSVWANTKIKRPELSPGVARPALAEITGRQFEWRIRYAGKDGIIGTEDDVFKVNDLHLPINEDVVLLIKSQDVLHSFFLPHLRVKQDVVPGMQQFVWFQAKRPGTYDIVCAELCGWGHYKMRGRFVVQNRAEFDKWLEQAWQEQEVSSFALPAGE
ncbi:Alternative cytochrome c oxidase subunit 2 [Anatilimnocola aggregata]|uniref:Cytochrome c oxidase subunit 2 n=1 Tax=Anatilimnocola aggregata TaxID=2528021 RepID=A0A517YN47_9BACT|nr:cytochrome c oxidase subunit II [Anatilimnocola aggregata]QDU31632.1 Alternative cytochrome c oxidase subunit 2 [Anatilimnocola aggregata]